MYTVPNVHHSVCVCTVRSLFVKKSCIWMNDYEILIHACTPKISSLSWKTKKLEKQYAMIYYFQKPLLPLIFENSNIPDKNSKIRRKFYYVPWKIELKNWKENLLPWKIEFKKWKEILLLPLIFVSSNIPDKNSKIRRKF